MSGALVTNQKRRGWTAAQLCRETFPPTRWAVPMLIPEGLTLLIGAPKIGKSLLALGLAVAVASGGRALGGDLVDQGPVLYLALEDGPPRIADRLGRLDAGAPEDLHFYFEWSRGQDAVQEVRLWLDEHPGARLIVVDTLARIKGQAPSGSTFYDADTAAVTAWQRLALDYNIAVVIVHHDRKASAEDFIDAVSGTHGLAGVADTTLLLERTRMEAVGRLRITGRDVEEAEYGLKRIGVRWELADGPPPDPNLGELANRIVAAVVEHPGGIGPVGVAAALSADEATVKVSLGRLVESGRLTKKGRGLYVLPFSPVTSVTSVTSAQTKVTEVTEVTGTERGSVSNGEAGVDRDLWDTRDEPPTGDPR